MKPFVPKHFTKMICACDVKYKDGSVKHLEFGHRGLMFGAMMHLWNEDVVSIEEGVVNAVV
jgi:hypothetical protein